MGDSLSYLVQDYPLLTCLNLATTLDWNEIQFHGFIELFISHISSTRRLMVHDYRLLTSSNLSTTLVPVRILLRL